MVDFFQEPGDLSTILTNMCVKVDLGIAKYHFEIGLEEAGRIADTTYEIKWA